MTLCNCNFITDWSIAKYHEILLLIPIEDKLATLDIH